MRRLWAVVLILGCGETPIVYNMETNKKLSQAVASAAADQSEDYARETYGLTGDWARRTEIYYTGQKKVSETCPISEELKAEGYKAAGCALSRYKIIVSDEADAERTLEHEFGHLMSFILFEDWDYSHTRLKDYYDRVNR